ncbi:hypothetical protein AHAS_Ahas16G0194600 [Arachis hypogaea]
MKREKTELKKKFDPKIFYCSNYGSNDGRNCSSNGGKSCNDTSSYRANKFKIIIFLEEVARLKNFMR